tara:strand:+ start:2181 stop:2360 length:180 start_codon:yes stop_codon:yes gene_type:complete
MIEDLKQLTFLLKKLKGNKEFNGVYINSEYLSKSLDSFTDILRLTEYEEAKGELINIED